MIAFRSLCFVWMLKKSDFLRCVCVCTKRCLLFCFYYCGHKSRVFLQSAVSAAPKWSKRINARKKSSAAQCSSRFKVAAAVAVVATAPTTAKCVVYCDPNCKLLPTPNIRNSSFVHTHTHTHRMKKCKLISTERALIDRAEFLLFRVLLLLLSRQRRRRRRRRKTRQESKVLANEKQRVRKTLLSTVGETNRRAGRFLLSVTRKQRRQEH